MPDELADVRGALSVPPLDRTVDTPQHSAVSLVFTPGRRLWLIQRARRAGDPWSGHVGFPGGRRAPDDPDLLHTSLRETREEVGLSVGPAHLLGRLHDLRTRPVRRLMVRPWVFALDHEPVWRPNRDEVASVMSVELDALLEGRGRGTMRWPRGVGVTLPKVQVGDQVLWGLSLQIVDDLLHRLDGRGQGLDRPVARAAGGRAVG